MDDHAIITHRRAVLAVLGLGGLFLPFAARAQLGGLGLGGGFTGLLGHASDNALDKLSQPGAFYNDQSIRILLPLVAGGGLGGILGDVMNMGDKLGVTDGITRTINDAAGKAAHAAKPVFRTAISRLTISDVPGIVGQGDGATQYLKRSAGDQLAVQVRPLIDRALGNAGAYRQLDRLNRSSKLVSAAGLTHDKLGHSVTEQAMNGIFKYMGGEERALRANPLGPAGSLLKGVMGGG
ncbi:MAG: DUF4197 domain-containing protein [Sphingomonadales bacterium]|nr:DUF4197 domain-containing protein [Sphingomonadales bacterium]MDE2567469.1 DUF4197 domain-containing protein [Sphingomonadales bacterium]